VLSIHLVAVPDLSRVLPVKTSGPVLTRIIRSRLSFDSRFGLKDKRQVNAFRLRAAYNEPQTNGVRPQAAIPSNNKPLHN
jgi:hypothetical protein